MSHWTQIQVPLEIISKEQLTEDLRLMGEGFIEGQNLTVKGYFDYQNATEGIEVKLEGREAGFQKDPLSGNYKLVADEMVARFSVADFIERLGTVHAFSAALKKLREQGHSLINEEDVYESAEVNINNARESVRKVRIDNNGNINCSFR